MNLNSQQAQAVSHFLGPCIVTACPGSGKTRVLTERTIALIRDKQIKPRQILCLTFTNKAANEMKERVASSLIENVNEVWISTFHRLCLSILRKHGDLVGLNPGFTVYGTKEQEELMAKIARMNQYEYSSVYDIRRLIKAVNDFREDLLNEEHREELNDLERDVINEYEDMLDSLNAIDFSGMLYKAWLILKDHESVRTAISNRFKFVLIDEMQDTNRIQYEIIKMVGKHSNLFVVGDIQQSIYGWRGAKPENLDRFRKDFEGVKEVILPRNYRSSEQILQAAESLIHMNDDAQAVNLISDRGAGPKISIKGHPTSDGECDMLVQNILKLRKHVGYDWKDFGVLYRVNSLSRSPELALRSASIPYRIIGGFSFFDRAEIKTVLSYLSLIANPHDTINFARAVSNPKRGVGKDTIGKLERASEQSEKSILEICKNADDVSGVSGKAQKGLREFSSLIEKSRKMEADGKDIGTIAKSLIMNSGYYQSLKDQADLEPTDKPRFDNVEEFLSGIEDFANNHKGVTFADYLQTIQLMTTDMRTSDGEEDAVQLLTMHSAKGLEWPVVHVIGVEEGTMPHGKALAERGIDEERRLMYVAMTRAMDYLVLSYCHLRRNRRAGKSIFLGEIYVDGSS